MLITKVRWVSGKAQEPEITLRSPQTRTLATQPIYSSRNVFGRPLPIHAFRLSPALPLDLAIQRDAIIQQFEGQAELLPTTTGWLLASRGTAHTLEKLPQYFYSLDQQLGVKASLEWQLYMPFGVAEERGAVYTVQRRLSLDEFLRLPSVSLDSEWIHWERNIDLEHIDCNDQTLKTFVREHVKKGTSETELPNTALKELLQYWVCQPEEPISIQLAFDKEIHHFTQRSKPFLLPGVTLHHSDSGPDLLNDVQDFLNTHPFTLLLTQNGMSYDLPKLDTYQQQHKKRFTMSGDYPRQSPKRGFFRMTEFPAVYVFDFASYSQHYFPFTVNNKFTTICSLVLGKKIEKRETYQDLTKLSIEQILGNDKSAQRLALYAAEDVQFMAAMEPYIKPMIYFKSVLFGRNPQVICTTAKRNLGLRAHKLRHLFTKKQLLPWNASTEKAYDSCTATQAFSEFYAPSVTRHRGSCPAALVYLAPFVSAWRNELETYTVTGDMLTHTSVNNSLGAFDILHTLEEGFLLPKIFYAYQNRFAQDRTTLHHIAQDLHDIFPKLQNAKGNFIVCDPHHLDDIEVHGTLLAIGQAFHIDVGSFLVNDGVNTYKFGVDVHGKGGFKTLWQQRLIQEITEHIFSHSAIDYITTEIEKLKNGALPREELIHFVPRIGRDYDNYSSYAQQQQRIQAYIALGVQKGETYAQAQLSQGRIPLTNFLSLPISQVFTAANVEYILEDTFGTKTTSGRKCNGKLGNYMQALLEPLGDPEIILRNIEAGKPPQQDAQLYLF